MGRKVYLSLIFSFLAIAGYAQNDDYNQFRQQILNDYSNYRGQVLDNYARFLDTVWKDYESFRGESLFPDRKPKVNPTAPKVDDTPFSVIPTPDKPTEPKPKPSAPIDIKPEAPSPLVDNVSFPFYTATVKSPKINVPHLKEVNEKAISRLWTEYQNNNVYSKISASLQRKQSVYPVWKKSVISLDFSEKV